MKNLRNALTSEEQQSFSRAIQERLFGLYEYQACKRIFTFISFQAEVDTCPMITRAWRDQKRVFVPKAEQNRMEFYEIHSFDHLIKSQFGVLEPPVNEETRYVGDKEAKLMILPGLAFDRTGNRIGYGAGYYDRFLSQHEHDHFTKIAVAYDFQVLEQIMAEEYDVKADILLTPSIKILCK
jgi:5-formyltetrahydrofolate cyclo-ligase